MISDFFVITEAIFVKTGNGRRLLSLVLTLALALTLMPAQALAGSQDGMEAVFFDLNRSDEYEQPSTDGILVQDASGTVRLSVSGGFSIDTACTVKGVYLVDADSRTERYSLLPLVADEDNHIGLYGEAGEYYLDVWLENIVIKNAQTGAYRLKVVTTAGTFYSDEYKDEYFETSGVATIISASSMPAGITTESLAEGYVKEPYSFTLKGTAVSSWSAEGLPAGLTLDSTSGVISGTPTESGVYSVTVKAAGEGSSARKNYTLTVRAARTFTVSFNLGNAPGYVPMQSGLTYGDTIELPEVSRTGYVFLGWFDNGDHVGGAGERYTVTGSVALRAKWQAKPGVTVKLPETIGNTAGNLWLLAETDLYTDCVWSTAGDQPREIYLSAAMLAQSGGTYERLLLCAYVDNAQTVIARYDGPVTAGDSETVIELTADGCAPFERLDEVVVPGLTEGVDYRVLRITNEDGVSVAQDSLVSVGHTYSVELKGIQDSYYYADYAWGVQTGLKISGGRLTLAVPEVMKESVAVSGNVVYENGTAFSGIIRSTQLVGGVYRIRTAKVNGSGVFSGLLIYPGAEATFTVQGTDIPYILSGGMLAATKSDVSGHTLTVRTVELETHIELKTSAATLSPEQQMLVNRYLNASFSSKCMDLSVTAGEASDHYSASVRRQRDIKLPLKNTGAASSVDCELTGALFDDVGAKATLAEGRGSISLEAVLYSGVVADLRTETQSQEVFYAFYDASGTYLDGSPSFFVGTRHGDYAAVCPAETETVVLLAAIEKSEVNDKKLSELQDASILASWSGLSLTGAGIAALDEKIITDSSLENAAYITRPNSELFAAADSFTSLNDLIAFSGTIDVDGEISGAELEQLAIGTKSPDGYWRNSAIVQAISFNGELYTGMIGEDHCTYETYQGLDHIKLPCTFTIYCSPAALDLDMEITVNAVINTPNQRYADQFVGFALCARPGAAIRTLSKYVNTDKVLVSGVASPNETVTLYDGGEYAGDVTAGLNGEWSAQIALNGVRDDAVTVHRLVAVSASGVRSEELTILHDRRGPQLKSFTMKLGGATYRVGAQYTFTGSLYNPSFTAEFSNEAALETMKAWGCKVVFKIYYLDGEIVFLPAEGSGPSFTATDNRKLGSAVSRAEVLYEPAVHTSFDAQTKTGTASAEEIKEAKELAQKVREEAGAYPTFAYSLTYDKDGKAIAEAADGTAADASFVKNLEENAAALCENGVGVSLVLSDEDYDTPTEEWLRLTSVHASIVNWYALHIGGYASENRSYTLTRRYTGGTDSEGNAITAQRAFELEKAYFDGLGAEHTAFSLGGSGSFDMYTIENEGTGLDGGVYLDRYVCASFAAVDGVYAATFTVTYSPRVCLKLVSEKLDALYGAVLMDGGDEAASIEEVEIRYSSNFTPEMHAELLELRWEKENLDCIWDIQSQRRLAELEHAEANAMEPMWLDENNYHYNGKFKPASNTSRTVMNEVGTGMGAIETASGDANSYLAITGALADGTSLGESLGPAGAVTAAANIYANIQNTVDAKEELEMMRGDMEQLMGSPCYKKLTAGNKAMVKEAYDEFMEYYQTAKNHLTGVSQLNFATGSGGAVLGKNPLAGLTFAGSSWMVNEVGGKMIENSFGGAIYLYEHNFAKIKAALRSTSYHDGDPNCAGKPTNSSGPKKSDGDGDNNKVGNDPSGIVYEGVIENPVQGARVSLYYAVSAAGSLVTQELSALAADLVPAENLRLLNPDQPTQVTGEDGRYQWGVPAGLWYVKAEYAGMAGDSLNDRAATVPVYLDGEQYMLLPVLPVQLDVNIPIVNASAPYVTSASLTDEGVLISFSRYMNEGDVLSGYNYTLVDENGKAIRITSVTSVEQGHAPSNIDPAETTYTRTVLLHADVPSDKGVTLTVSGNVVSYCGSALGADCSIDLAASGLNVTRSGSKLHYEITLPQDSVNINLVAASYDADGRLLNVTSETVVCNKTCSGELTVGTDGDRCKVFVLDSDSKPLLTAWSGK